jgi:ubiquinone biosynthesis accessory factor UbiJ
MLGLSGFPSAAAARAINHVLRTHPLNRERLAAHADKTLQLEAGPVRLDWRIQPSGEFAVHVSDERPADLIVHIAPGQMLAWLGGREEAFTHSRFDGDGDLAADLGKVMRELGWSPEQDLARLIGDIPAHRLLQLAGSFLGWRARLPLWLAAQLAEYWTHEQPLIAGGEAVRTFVAEVDRLRDDVERLEKRLGLLFASRR